MLPQEKTDISLKNTKLTVLVVEDNKLLLILLQDALKAEQYETQFVSTAEDALALINKGEEFNLLLTDYLLPGIDGVALMIEARKKLPDLKAILISGLTPEFVEIPDNLANITFIQKPYDPLLLRQQVESLLLGA